MRRGWPTLPLSPAEGIAKEGAPPLPVLQGDSAHLIDGCGSQHELLVLHNSVVPTLRKPRSVGQPHLA